MPVTLKILAVPLLLWLGGCAAGAHGGPYLADASNASPGQPAAAITGAMPAQAAVEPLRDETAAGEDLEHPRTREIAAVPGVVMVQTAADREANRRQLALLQTMITKQNPLVGNVTDQR